MPTKNEVLSLLYLRDDLASGLLLLDAAGVSSPIHQSLAHADALGESLKDVFHPHTEGDERLRRAGIDYRTNVHYPMSCHGYHRFRNHYRGSQ